MLNFLDANVLLALLWDRHVHSELARRWFDQTSEGESLFCRFAQLTVLRLLTTESIMGSDARSMAGAWTAWDRLAVDGRLGFIGEPAGLEAELRSRSRSTQPLAQSLGRCLSPGLCRGRGPEARHL